ncbi:16S ribosomal RNA methyltransferase RsmE [Candidatus Fokinia cryptica]|uniref:Ribosomal RNA small subunit methyltransferase E n=2 Tax=Candidatus Fokinia crypta TaxID=1920990 RepID=A0ABZ0UNR4_9RICK|nr:16S ribosomal RNA methyltransferase RsmE [Candidatus Fokinia cryptica]
MLNESIKLSDLDSNHIKNVLRQEVGDKILVLNEDGSRWLANIEEVRKKVIIRIVEQLEHREINTVSNNIHIIFCPTKSHNLQFFISKIVECEVEKATIMLSERTVLRRISEHKIPTYIKGAVEQSDNIKIPIIKVSNTFIDAITDAISPNVLVVLLHTQSLDCLYVKQFQKFQNLDTYITENHIKDVVFVVGAEGGWSESELNSFLLLTKQFSHIGVWKIGNSVMRAETAFMSAICASNILVGKW